MHGGLFHEITGQRDENPDGLTVLYREVIPSFLVNQFALFERVFGCCEKMEDKRYRQATALAQRDAVLNMTRNFNGAKEIASTIRQDWST